MQEIEFERALSRMPHRGEMLLIEKVLTASEDAIRCRGRVYEKGRHPLAVDGALYPVCLVELGAQAAAAHASISTVQGGHIGLLVALQNVAVHAARLDDEREALEVEARRIDASLAAARYEFSVMKGETRIVTGEALMTISAAEPKTSPEISE